MLQINKVKGKLRLDDQESMEEIEEREDFSDEEEPMMKRGSPNKKLSKHKEDEDEEENQINLDDAID